MYVKNINDTFNKKCSCSGSGSWLDHWEKYSGRSLPSSCRAMSCSARELVGAHVKMVGGQDSSSYIIPLCPKHSKDDSDLCVVDEDLVPADCKSVLTHNRQER